MEFLMMLLVLLFLLGECVFLIRVVRVPAHLAPLTAILFDTLVLFLLAELGILVVAFYFVVLLGVGFCIFAVIRLFEKDEQQTGWLPIAAFALIVFAAFFYSRGTLFYAEEEFAQWGLLYRFLMTTNTLPTDLNVVSGVYYPFATLWQYFVSQIVGFSEANAYFAHLLIEFAALIAIFPVVKWEHAAKYLLVLSAAILSIFAFDFYFQNLQVYLLSALLFAAGISTSLTDEPYAFARFAVAAVIISALALTFPQGNVLALIVAIVNMAAIITSNARKTDSDGRFERVWRSVLDYRILLMIVVPLLLWMSWKQFSQPLDLNPVAVQPGTTALSSTEMIPLDSAAYLSALQQQEQDLQLSQGILKQPTLTVMGSGDFWRMFTIGAPYRTRLISNAFINSISNTPIGSSKITLKMILIAILAAITINELVLRPRGQRLEKRGLTVNALLAFGFVLYCVSLFITYVLSYPPIQALSVPSLASLVGVYLLAWWLINLCLACLIITQSPASGRIVRATAGLFAVSAALFLFIPTSNYIHLPVSPSSARFQTEALARQMNLAGVQPSDKVYEVFGTIPLLKGEEHEMLRYFLAPGPANSVLWDFTNRDKPGGSYQVKITPEQWDQILNLERYTYVLVTTSDADFWKTYGGLFGPHPEDLTHPQLFKVSTGKFEYVPMALTSS